jgi:hypothetical protein
MLVFFMNLIIRISDFPGCVDRLFTWLNRSLHKDSVVLATASTAPPAQIVEGLEAVDRGVACLCALAFGVIGSASLSLYAE